MPNLDDIARPLLPDALDAVAHALGVVNPAEAQEEAALAALMDLARLIQRDSLAAVLAGRIDQ